MEFGLTMRSFSRLPYMGVSQTTGAFRDVAYELQSKLLTKGVYRGSSRGVS